MALFCSIPNGAAISASEYTESDGQTLADSFLDNNRESGEIKIILSDPSIEESSGRDKVRIDRSKKDGIEAVNPRSVCVDFYKDGGHVPSNSKKAIIPFKAFTWNFIPKITFSKPVRCQHRVYRITTTHHEVSNCFDCSYLDPGRRPECMSLSHFYQRIRNKLDSILTCHRSLDILKPLSSP